MQQTSNTLKSLGYDAIMISNDLVAIRQNGRMHSLSAKEAQDLVDSTVGKPLDINQYWNHQTGKYHFTRA